MTAMEKLSKDVLKSDTQSKGLHMRQLNADIMTAVRGLRRTLLQFPTPIVSSLRHVSESKSIFEVRLGAARA